MVSIKEVFKNNPDGFSINYKELEVMNYKNGFAVGLTDFKINGTYLETHFKKCCLIANSLNVDNDKLIIGGWLDQKTNNYYLDVSLWVETKEEALNLAKLFDQKGIYDFKNNDTIYLKEVL